MKLLPNKFSYKITLHEMEDLINLLEAKIAETLPLYNNGLPPIDNLTFNYMVKCCLIDLRSKLIRQYETSRATRFKITLNFLQANAFLAAFKFNRAGIAWRINSEIHPKIL